MEKNLVVVQIISDFPETQNIGIHIYFIEQFLQGIEQMLVSFLE